MGDLLHEHIEVIDVDNVVRNPSVVQEPLHEARRLVAGRHVERLALVAHFLDEFVANLRSEDAVLIALGGLFEHPRRGLVERGTPTQALEGFRAGVLATRLCAAAKSTGLQSNPGTED